MSDDMADDMELPSAVMRHLGEDLDCRPIGGIDNTLQQEGNSVTYLSSLLNSDDNSMSAQETGKVTSREEVPPYPTPDYENPSSNVTPLQTIAITKLPHECVTLETVETINTFDNFIDPSAGGQITISGCGRALDSLLRITSGGAQVQYEIPHGPYKAYEPLQMALRQVYFQLGLECPSAKDLCRIHRDPDHHDALYDLAIESVVPLHQREDILDLNGMVAILRVLAMHGFQFSSQYKPYQLGLVCMENDIMHARIYPRALSQSSETVWLFLQPGSPPYVDGGTWFGICSDHAANALQTPTRSAGTSTTFEQFLPSAERNQIGFSSGQSEMILSSLTPPMTSAPNKKGRSAKRRLEDPSPTKAQSKRAKTTSTEVGKRTTAIQIRQLRNELPSNWTPAQILSQQGDILHYNNLLRVAIWYGNKEIFDRLNDMCTHERKTPYKALSAITKRIGVAVRHLADQHGAPHDLLRSAFNAKRTDNNISTRDIADKLDSAQAQQLNHHRWSIETALDKIWSNSPDSGLAKAREMAPPVIQMFPPNMESLASVENGESNLGPPDAPSDPSNQFPAGGVHCNGGVWTYSQPRSDFEDAIIAMHLDLNRRSTGDLKCVSEASTG